jgi:hypothetical protein
MTGRSAESKLWSGLRRVATLGAIIFALLLVIVTSASAAVPAPAWTLHVAAHPSNLEPGAEANPELGPVYQIEATNIGGATTSGPFRITDTLPEGITVSTSVKPMIHWGRPAGGGSHTAECSQTGRIVTCEGGTGGASDWIPSGEVVTVDLYVDVSSAVDGTLTNSVTIDGGAASTVSATVSSPVTNEQLPFGLLEGQAGLSGTIVEASGAASRQAGAHPYSYEAATGNVNTYAIPGNSVLEPFTSGGNFKDIFAELPRGMVVNPQAVPKCSEERLETTTEELVDGKPGCPLASQVGVITLLVHTATGAFPIETVPLYNMLAPAGAPANFGFSYLEGIYSHLIGNVRSDGSYVLVADSTDLPAKVPISGFQAILWGNPTDESHDEMRGICLQSNPGGKICPSEVRLQKPFVTMPSHCGGVLEAGLSMDSWLDPGILIGRHFAYTGAEGIPIETEGCNRLQFDPTLEAKATTDRADSPTGLDVDINVPQNEELQGLATANVKDVSVTLPAGMTVNPSAANGLGGCSEPQIDLGGSNADTCPNESKLGTAEVVTPLLEKPLEGSFYLATPYANPFHSLLAAYLSVKDPEHGVFIKVAGEIHADPKTGQLTATFRENPEVPFEDLKISLFEGSAASLTTPFACGQETVSSVLTPWSTPEGVDATPSDNFAIESPASGSATCPRSEADAPASLSFSAGTETPLSGAYSPFVLRLSRPDGSQHITGLETTLPGGLLGKLAGVAYCPESGIAQAVSREKPEQGKLEQGSPSCPSSSEVGTVNVTAGSGPSPILVSGHAYLAGPYKGAPLSLVVIVPAVAGPFDLGTVVDRVALNVGEYDGRIHAVADPLPTIREGIPLDVRSIELNLSRPSFTLNPTSCEVMAIEGSVTTQAGKSQSLSNRFQVGECGRLAFKPKLAISLKGPTKRTGHPALKAVVTYPKKGAYANIARAQVNLPHSEFLDQGNIGKACTKVLIAARSCPAKSIYGKAKAWSPLLEKPLQGPVYLVGGYGYKLPALVAELNGQIRVLLVGKIDTGKNKGIRNTFEAVPDAPISRFVLEMKGGKKYGLLENSENVCKKTPVAGASFRAQNGKVHQFSSKVTNSCGKAKRRPSGKGPKGKKASL